MGDIILNAALSENAKLGEASADLSFIVLIGRYCVYLHVCNKYLKHKQLANHI